MNPWSSQQQIVWGVRVNYVACYLESQIPNLVSELNLSHRVRTIGVEAIDGCLGYTQLVRGDPQMLHDSAVIMLNADPEST